MPTEIHVNQDGTGVITLDVSPPSNGKPLKLAIYDGSTRRYLTQDGWASSRKTIAELIPGTQPVEITLAAETVGLIKPGTVLVIEEIFINLREQVVWPKSAARQAPIIAKAQPVTPPIPTSVNEPVPESRVPALNDLPKDAVAAKDRWSPWLAGCLGLLLGAVAVYALLRFSPPVAALVFPEITQLSQENDQTKNSIHELISQVNAKRELIEEMAAREATMKDQLANQQKIALDVLKRERSLQDGEAILAKAEQRLATQAEELKTARDAFQIEANKASLKSDAQNNGSAEVLALQSTVDLLRLQLSTSSKSRSDSERASFTSERDQLRQNLQKAETEVQRLRAQIGSPDTVSKLQGDLASANRQLSSAIFARDVLREQLQIIQKDYTNLTSNFDAQSKKIAEYVSRQQSDTASGDVSIENFQLKRDRAQINAKNSDLQLEIQTRDKRIVDLQQTIDAISSRLYMSNLQSLAATREADRLKSELAVAKQQASTRGIWGATAKGGDGQFHSVQNQTSRKAAEEIALKVCKGGSGYGCKIVVADYSICFALARVDGVPISKGGWGWATSADWHKAENDAKLACQKNNSSCTVKYSICSPDGLKPE